MGSKIRAPRRCSLLMAPPLCLPQGALSAGNNSTETEGKPARPAMQAEPLSSFLMSPSREGIGLRGGGQASSKLGRVCKLDILAEAQESTSCDPAA